MQPEDKIQEIAERAERLQEIGSSILRVARDELYLGMRFLDVALSSFSYQMDGQVHGIEHGPLDWELRVLATGPPGKSPDLPF